MKQKIGNIKNSKQVNIFQNTDKDVEQEIGDISDSESVHLTQNANNILSKNDYITYFEYANNINKYFENSSIVNNIKVIEEIKNIILKENKNIIITKSDIEDVSNEIKNSDSTSNQITDHAINSMVTSVSFSSGAIAISQLTDPIQLAIAIPITLAIAGYLEKDKLFEITDNISKKIKSFF